MYSYSLFVLRSPLNTLHLLPANTTAVATVFIYCLAHLTRSLFTLHRITDNLTLTGCFHYFFHILSNYRYIPTTIYEQRAHTVDGIDTVNVVIVPRRCRTIPINSIQAIRNIPSAFTCLT